MSGVREICFDTETTGFHAKGDDRVTEIGCIELIDMLPTGREFHALVDPQRDIPEKVTQLTGHTLANLRDFWTLLGIVNLLRIMLILTVPL